jgi:hypothetical protein
MEELTLARVCPTWISHSCCKLIPAQGELKLVALVLIYLVGWWTDWTARGAMIVEL